MTGKEIKRNGMKKYRISLGIIGDIAVLYVGYLMFNRVNSSIKEQTYDGDFYLFLLAFVMVIAYVIYRMFFILKNKKFEN